MANARYSETLSASWLRVQEELLLWLNGTTCGLLNEHDKRLVTFLAWPASRRSFPAGRDCLGARCRNARHWHGPCRESCIQLFNPAADRDVVRGHKTLRWLCGWQRAGEVSGEATFSRALAEFATSALPSQLHEALIQDTHADRLVGHISRTARRRRAPRHRRTRGRVHCQILQAKLTVP